MPVRDATFKSAVLIEALPFLKQFHHQYVVVKLGGTPIEDAAVLDSLLTDLVWLEQVGVRPILVHGGGSKVTSAMAEAGLEPKFNNGRRITDRATMDIAFKAFSELNMHLVNRITELGGVAIGLVPPRHEVVKGVQTDEALGLVGAPTGVDTRRIIRYASRGIIPVLPPVSISPDGEVLNTNADDLALAVAKALRVEKLVFCSTVPGVCRDPEDPSTRISSLTPETVPPLIKDGTISGGMIPKIENCLAALDADVHKIHIVDAGMQHALLLEIFTKEGIGTQIWKGEDHVG